MYDSPEKSFTIFQDVLSDFLQTKLTGVGATDLKPQVNFEKIKDFRFGHLTLNTALQYSKILKVSPMQLANEIAVLLQNTNHSLAKLVFSSITIHNPGFINLTFSPHFFVNLINFILNNQDYGNNTLECDKIWAIEHTSPNPNKAMHIGHLRNNLVGMSLSNLLKSCGAKVIKEAIMNDRGIAIAKLMYGYLYGMVKEDSQTNLLKPKLSLQEFINYWANNKDDWQTPASLDIKEDLFVSQCYLKGEEFMTTDEGNIRQLVVDWENNDLQNHQLWDFVLSYSYKGMERTLKRLGSAWDKVWHESEHYKEGKGLVEEGLQKGIFQKLEDGAVLTNLQSYNLPDTILQKRDGTSLYITQDLALTKKKKLENKADKLIWVIGPDQSLAMKQVFACCEQLGIGKLEDFWHISYGYVGLADTEGNFTKMSSRKGNVLLIDEVIDLVKTKLKEQMQGAEDTQIEKLALAAIKFAILKSNKDEPLTFDIEKSVDLKGDTGIYIMYTLARIHSILEKAGQFERNVIVDDIFEKISSQPLARTLYFYPLAVEKSFKEKSTHHVAQYLLELASSFNSFYEQEKIIDEKDQNKVKLKLLLATEQIVLHGLEILNIEPVFKI